MDKIAVSL